MAFYGYKEARLRKRRGPGRGKGVRESGGGLVLGGERGGGWQQVVC